ncbi:hypothetical protein J7K41_01945 [Candidatus Micrarchaeota archaeon]|nr:hypothetical protein [Candidatus Micrarchaeota archaeon]
MGNEIEPPTKKRHGTEGFTWEVYAIAFVISGLVFLIGIFIGINITKSSVSDIEDSIYTLNDNTMSLQVLTLTSSDPSLFCNVYRELSDKFEEESWKIGEQIDYLEQQRGVSDLRLKSQYSNLEFRNFMLVRLANERCNGSFIPILYFYSNNKDVCPHCFQQGTELFMARKELLAKNMSVRIYSFDGDLDNIAIDVLKKQFNVSSYPTIVIGNTVYRGMMSKDEIVRAVESEVSTNEQIKPSDALQRP